MRPKAPVFSVCLTRQQLCAARTALREHHARLIREHGAWVINEHSPHKAAAFDALQKVCTALLDAGGLDDTK